eukprot:TRINITY_DN8848_c1_g1_i1.p1 TRINITY_DN8848_c1_g1~~TRINITY_DN8848_c1_g1_i1.p1  ORF type:complete len:850 (+),score=187.30 TRINITY_DN8848_c1_g1_i1:59-2608(+)
MASEATIELDEEEISVCRKGGKGLILPLIANEYEWNDYGRAFLYMIFLGWCFMGVGIVSDIFMEAIEKITSKRARKFNPVTKTFLTVFVWNPTVANLTLMALGSSAPEILLSIIELLGNEVYSGALGPSTIVGSAAFNLFCIIAVCVMSIPDGEVRFIKEIRVYAITSVFSVFAYLWLLVILLVTSPNVVEIWEGVVTFIFFPVLVTLAYAADRGWMGGEKVKMGRGSVISADMTKDELKALEDDIRKRHGSGNTMSEEMVSAIMKIECAEPSSIAQYRKKVRHKTAPKDDLPTPGAPDAKPPTTDPAKIVPLDSDDEILETKIEFVTFSFMIKTKAVLEDIGKVEVIVLREGLLDRACSVAYRTKDGPAKANEDYKHMEGRLQFAAGDTEKTIYVEIVDDDKYKEDQEFYVELLNPEVQSNQKGKQQAGLGDTPTMTIKIIDNDVPGVLCFGSDTVYVNASQDEDTQLDIIVRRKDGATGSVSCKYRSEGDSAQSGEDFEEVSGTVEFANGECEKNITCTIKGKTRYEAEQLFRIILDEVEGGARFDKHTDGGEECCICTVFIKADINQQGGLQKIASSVALRWDKARTGNANWAAQFKDALFTVYDDEDDEGGEDEEKVRSIGEKINAYLMYVLQLPWKLLFACIPPTDYCGGWVCFVCSLIMIGAVTAIIGDVAAIFGCCLGVPDAVTAITFVALGTSLPDTFASKTAAQQDPHADASVGNVTGSNSVNVFLGLGLPWSIGAIYWTLGTTAKWDAKYSMDPDIPEAFRSGAFIVKAGDLSFSVGVFSACALICIGALAVRRKLFGGELGGPTAAKYITSASLVGLWLLYVALSSWKAIDTMNKSSS